MGARTLEQLAAGVSFNDRGTWWNSLGDAHRRALNNGNLSMFEQAFQAGALAALKRAAAGEIFGETIVAAAVRWNLAAWRERENLDESRYPDVVVTAPPPARHPSLVAPINDLLHLIVPIPDQGFLTSTGRFVGREEALKIALASGQPMIDHPSRHDRLLFSEDLW